MEVLMVVPDEEDNSWIMTSLSDSVTDYKVTSDNPPSETAKFQNKPDSKQTETNAKLRRLISEGKRMVLAKNPDGSFTSKEQVLTQLLQFEYCNLELEKAIRKMERINQNYLGLSLNQTLSLARQLKAIAKYRNEEDTRKLLTIVSFLEKSKASGIDGNETRTIIANLDDICSFVRIFDRDKVLILIKKIEAELAKIPENSRRQTKYTRKFCDLLKKITQDII